VTAAATPRVLVLAKRTSYGTLVEEQHDARVTKLIADDDATVRRLKRSHDAHQETVEEVTRALEKLGATFELRVGARAPITDSHELVVTVGGDGTLLAASHEIGPGTRLLGINSSPESSVGFFCAGEKGTALETLAGALDGSMPAIELTRMRVEVNGRCVHARVLNEALFCHATPAATSRYILSVDHAAGGEAEVAHEEEEQRSSGLWIGPAAGSTAAQHSAGGRVLPLHSRELQYVVREAYARFGVPPRMTMGLVEEGGQIAIRSKMLDARLFLDGPHIAHEIQIGDCVGMRRSDETLTVLGLTRRRNV